jgi:hypothetical protein
MRHYRRLCSILWLSLTICGFARASEENSFYIGQIIRDDPASLKLACQELYRARGPNTEVLDVLAEVLMEQAFTAHHTEVDALSWACRAISASRDSRYRTVLTRIYKSRANSKIRKYARAAIDYVGKGGDQYEPGTIDLKALREKYAAPPAPAPEVIATDAAPEPRPAKPKEYQSISAVRVGMSMQEVVALIGPPTSTAARATGKGFIPFYHGGDSARSIAMYKGQGRIIYNRRTGYSGNLRVLEILHDETERGHP